MKGILIFVLLLSAAQDVISQPLGLVPYRKGTRWGYSTLDGNVVIKPEYDRTFFFSSDSVARVTLNGKYGFIDRRGHIVLPIAYTKATDFVLGTAHVVLDGRDFCINLQGDKDECTYVDIEPDEEELSHGFLVMQDSTGQKIIVESTGDTIPDSFDEVKLVSRYFFPNVNHFALVRKKDRWGAYNRMGMLIAPVEFRVIDVLDMDSYKAIKDNLWGVNDFKGHTVLPFQYDSIAKVTELLFLGDRLQKNNHFIVSKNKKFGIIDSDRKTILKMEYDAVQIPLPCACPTEYAVSKNGRVGLIDFKGKFIVPVKYASVQPFQSAEITLVQTLSGQEGYINRKGLEYFSD
jgi:hypothetical protein